MKLYPGADFYYTEDIDGTTYTTIETGIIDAARIIQNKEDYWVSKQSPKAKKKKTLILNDWTLIHKNYNFNEKITILKSLLSEPHSFEMLAWKKGEFAPLSYGNIESYLADFYNTREFECVTQDAFEKALSEQGLNPKQCIYLDGFQILNLSLKERDKKEFYINLSDILNVGKYSENPNVSRKIILDKLATQYKNRTLIIDCFSEGSVNFLNEFQDYFKAWGEVRQELVSVEFNEAIHKKISTGELIFDGLNFPKKDSFFGNLTYLLKSAKDIKRLGLKNCNRLAEDNLPLDNIDLSAPEEIDLSDSNISAENLGRLLKKAPNLKKMNLGSCKNLAGGMPLDDADLSALEKINLRESNISSENLGRLLEKAPNLKNMNLVFCKNLTDDMPLDNVDLSALEKINLSDSNISAENLVHLLKKASNLKKILLIGCNNLADDMPLDDADLSALEELDLSYSNISAENLGRLLEKAPNLKKMDLRRCTNLAGGMPLDDADLSALEGINLRQSNISAENLVRLLEKAPNLKKMDLRRCTNLAGGMPLDDADLSALEEINLRESNISAENLVRLLEKAPNLKKMNLGSCTNLAGGMPLDDADLSALEEINLRESNISSENLGRLLEKAPNLKNMNLVFCKNLTDDMPLDNVDLSALEKINLTDSNISAENLVHLLEKAPNLKKINLYYCTNLADDMYLDNVDLSALEKIDLSDSNISAENLGRLLEKAPNLKNLNLDSCENLTDDMHLDNADLSALEEINLSDSNISSENIVRLLQKVPNLKNLDLGSCTNLDGNIPLDKVNLNFLEEFNTNGSNISPQSHNRLVEKSPKLKLAKSAEVESKCNKSIHTPVASTSSATHQDSNQDSCSFDADTALNQDKTFNLERKIYRCGAKNTHPEPRDYRQDVYGDLSINLNPASASDIARLSKRPLDLEMLKQGDDKKYEGNLIEHGNHLQSQSAEAIYFARLPLHNTDEWVALLGLTAQDTITHLNISPETSYTLAYSQSGVV